MPLHVLNLSANALSAGLLAESLGQAYLGPVSVSSLPPPSLDSFDTLIVYALLEDVDLLVGVAQEFILRAREARKRIVGIGHGALVVNLALGGSIENKDQLTFGVETLGAPSESALAGWGLSRVLCHCHQGDVDALSETCVWVVPRRVFQSTDDLVVGLLGHPEITPLALLENYLPLLDDERMLTETVAQHALNSVRMALATSGVLPDEAAPPLFAVLLLEPDPAELIRLLRAELAALRMENAQLRQQAARVLENAPSLPFANPEHGPLRFLLAGVPLDQAYSMDEQTLRRREMLVPANLFPARPSPFAAQVHQKAAFTCGLALPPHWFVCGSTNKTLSIMWQSAVHRTIGLPAIPLCLAWHAETRSLFAGMMDGQVHKVQLPDAAADAATDAAGWPAASAVAWKHSKHVNGLVLVLHALSDAWYCVSVSRDESIVSFNLRSLEVDAKWKCKGTPECCVSVCGGGLVAVSIRDDYRLHLCDPVLGVVRTVSLNDPAAAAEPDEHCSFCVLALASLPGTGLVLAATDKNLVLLLDVADGGRGRVRTYSGHACSEYSRPCLAWSEDGLVFACSSDPSGCVVWSLATGESRVLQGGHASAVRAMCFAGRDLLTCGMDGVVGRFANVY
jgi:GMP synthase-like glutamine amidotransferase